MSEQTERLLREYHTHSFRAGFECACEAWMSEQEAMRMMRQAQADLRAEIAARDERIAHLERALGGES